MSGFFCHISRRNYHDVQRVSWQISLRSVEWCCAVGFVASGEEKRRFGCIGMYRGDG